MSKSEGLAQVKLTKPHTHAGVKYPVGAVIDVPELDAAWLQENKVGEPVPKAPEPKPEPKAK